MQTSLGRYCRQLRIDRNEILKDMTDKLGCRLSYLSGIENGREPAPDELINQIIEVYALDTKQADQLRNAVKKTAYEIKTYKGKWSGY